MNRRATLHKLLRVIAHNRFYLATDLISEFTQIKSFKNQNVKREKVKYKEGSRRKRSGKNA